jgi:hypothetical protein
MGERKAENGKILAGVPIDFIFNFRYSEKVHFRLAAKLCKGM